MMMCVFLYMLTTTAVSAFSLFGNEHNNNRYPTCLKLSSSSSLSEYCGLPRLCYSNDNVVFAEGVKVVLNKDQSHYLGTVLRKKKVGMKIRLFQPNHDEWLVRISELDKLLISVECLQPIRTANGQWIGNDKDNTVTASQQPWLFFAPIQSKSRMKFLLEKCTELGVSQFIPIGSNRGHVPTLQSFQTFQNSSSDENPTDIMYMSSNAKKKNKNDKYTSILIEASEQCERMTIPILSNQLQNKHTISNLEELLEYWSKNDNGCNNILYICRERKSSSLLTSIVNNQQQVGFVIGPEGGWSPEEEELIQDYCQSYPQIIQGISLGNSILRAETAAILAIGTYSLLSQQLQNDEIS